MKYVFDKWEEVKRKLKNKTIVLFLDYDGTLTPIVKSPDKAVITGELKQLLGKLKEAIKLVIISGRSLNDVKQKIGIEGIQYVGNHGLEIEGPKLRFESPVSLRYRTILNNIKTGLESRLASIKGVYIEDKGLALSLHFRQVPEAEVPLVKTAFHELAILYLVRGKIKVNAGKKVLEVRPPTLWDKGKAALWLLARWDFSSENKPVPLYIGDDITDEDAFKALAGRGITIRVEKSISSLADYYLRDTEEVKVLLEKLLSNLTRKD